MFDHERAIGSVVDGVVHAGLPCVLVDDGSRESCARELTALAAARPGKVTLVRHAENRGKGAAVLTGLARAQAMGFDHVLQIDADGQHDPSDIPRFLAVAAAHPAAVIIGIPVFDASIPAYRLYFRYLTHVLVWLNTLSLAIHDTMCGFRVYPIAPVVDLARQVRLGQRMDFDIEVLVRLYWADIEIVNQPTPVRYPTDGISHFDMWRDNALIARLHATLFAGMLARAPRLIAKHWKPA